jgi:hypothetical protein
MLTFRAFRRDDTPEMANLKADAAYLPVMALFGLPGALGLPGKTWPWLITATFLLLYATFRVTPTSTPTPTSADEGRRPGALGRAAFWLACPVMAFPLTMGITDPPVIALICLALALLVRAGRGPANGVWRRDAVLAALVLGVACAMKYTAWPALAIIAVMVAARDGGRSAIRFTAIVLATAAGLVAALAPAALRHPASILLNTVAYPLGLTSAKSPAQSPLPGHLLATLGSGGHLAALILLAAAGLATAASLVIAPPVTPPAAARRIAIGLTALFMLSSATRCGYFIYPIALYAWAVLASRADGLPAHGPFRRASARIMPGPYRAASRPVTTTVLATRPTIPATCPMPASERAASAPALSAAASQGRRMMTTRTANDR